MELACSSIAPCSLYEWVASVNKFYQPTAYLIRRELTFRQKNTEDNLGMCVVRPFINYRPEKVSLTYLIALSILSNLVRIGLSVKLGDLKSKKTEDLLSVRGCKIWVSF